MTVLHTSDSRFIYYLHYYKYYRNKVGKCLIWISFIKQFVVAIGANESLFELCLWSCRGVHETKKKKKRLGRTVDKKFLPEKYQFCTFTRLQSCALSHTFTLSFSVPEANREVF